jgi:hypothetical protein
MDGQQPRYTYVARNYVHEFGECVYAVVSVMVVVN